MQPQELLFEFRASKSISKILELLARSVPVEDDNTESKRTDKTSCDKFIFNLLKQKKLFYYVFSQNISIKVFMVFGRIM
ncbi:MAG: hypothetical protein J6Q51_04085 [Clostridia bacterium]|nr:hypothetical protein [Clostridia bacterium]